MRFDFLREIETVMTAEVRKLHHLGLKKVLGRSTLSDANARYSEKFFEEVYLDLYARKKDKLFLDTLSETLPNKKASAQMTIITR